MNDPRLYTSPKWELMKEVAANSQSPTSLAKKLHTSIPNVLHHLKLLEAYGIITGKPAKPKRSGKPPTLYGLVKPLAFIALLDKLGSQRKTINPNDKEKYLLKCMLEYKGNDAYALMKLSLDHPEIVAENSMLSIANFNAGKADLLVLSPDISKFRTDKSKIAVKLPDVSYNFTVWSHTKEEFGEGLKKKEPYFISKMKSKILHDPKNELAELFNSYSK